MRNKYWLVNVLTFLAALAVNFLATSLPLNGLTTGQISDQFQIFFVPAGYVFSIWGVIYLWLIAFLIYQSLPAGRNNAHIARIGPWFAISNLANAIWLVCFHYLKFGLALVFMLILLISLIIIFLRLGIGAQKAAPGDDWLVNAPFSVYLVWITVATIANATQVLYVLDWNGFGISPEIWLVIMLAAAAVISALMSLTRRNIAHALVLVWAFVGIAVKFPQVPLVTSAAWAAAGLVALVLLFALLSKPAASKA